MAYMECLGYGICRCNFPSSTTGLCGSLPECNGDLNWQTTRWGVVQDTFSWRLADKFLKSMVGLRLVVTNQGASLSVGLPLRCIVTRPHQLATLQIPTLRQHHATPVL